jgi:hypothetical protein
MLETFAALPIADAHGLVFYSLYDYANLKPFSWFANTTREPMDYCVTNGGNTAVCMGRNHREVFFYNLLPTSDRNTPSLPIILADDEIAIRTHMIVLRSVLYICEF